MSMSGKKSTAHPAILGEPLIFWCVCLTKSEPILPKIPKIMRRRLRRGKGVWGKGIAAAASAFRSPAAYDLR